MNDCASEILKVLAAEDSLDSASDEEKIIHGQNQAKRLLNMKLRHVEITYSNNLSFNILLMLFRIKFRDFNIRADPLFREY